MILNICLLLVFIICFAMMWPEGMWSNALTLLNTLLAALVATNYFEPVAARLDKQFPTFTYFWDYLSLWLLFAVSFTLLRAITDSLSRVRVRFKVPVEPIGAAVFAALTGWIMVCFTTMSLQTAPLARNAFRGSLQPTPTAEHFFGLGPGVAWLGFVQHASEGPLATLGEPHVFDPQGEYVLKYSTRRYHLSQEEKLRVRK